MKSIFCDNGQLNEQAIHRAAQHYAMPDYVKHASIDDSLLFDAAALPGTVFGDRENRAFALHNKAACWFAAVDLEEQRHTFTVKYANKVAAAIGKAAAAWGILPDVAAVRNKAQELRSCSLRSVPDCKFAMVRKLANGEVERKYPLRNPAEITAAAAWLSKWAYEFPRSDRQKIAQRIVEEAEDTSAAVPEDQWERLQLLAGRGVPDRRKLAAAMVARARLLPPNAAVDLYKVAGLLHSAADGDVLAPEVAEKMIGSLDDVDRLYGLTHKYAEGLQTPEASCYVCSVKTAAAALNDTVQLVSGHIYASDDLTQLPLSTLSDTLGADIAEQCSSDGLFVDREKMAEVAETLPLPDARILVELLQQHGVSELAKTAASQSTRLSHSDWLAIKSL